MLPYQLHPLAERELDEAVARYEGVAPGKGLELHRQVEAAIAQVRQFPESAPISRGLIRSIPVQPTSRWRYTVHYVPEPELIWVLAVAHQSRQPFYWLRRRAKGAANNP